MRKLSEAIETMNPSELSELKKKLEEGEIARTVEDKLEIFKNKTSICPVCNSTVGDNDEVS